MSRHSFGRTSGIASLAILGLMASLETRAQSTGTRIEEAQLEEIVVSSRRINVSALMQQDGAPKSRTNVGAEYIETQSAGQSVIQSLNLVPGVNFTNSDPYGSSGGNLRMRGFDGNRVSLMLDGVQLNDTGNYAIYTNQMLDPELIQQASVNLGTTDVDSPTASATGGTVNLSMRRPSETAALVLQPSFGSYGYRRLFTSVDTGAIGPWDSRMLLAYSGQQYDKFKGPGSLQKNQVDAGFYEDLGNNDFVSLSLHYNRNRNSFYRNLSFADIATSGYELDNDATCSRPTPTGGTSQNEATSATGTTALCTNYYNLRINPSNTGNVRMQSSFGLTDVLRLTIDPSFQYTLANGGGISIISESDSRLKGASTASGVDLNGDGDVLDRVAIYSPNNTKTNRLGVGSSLIWSLAQGQVVRFGYTLDHGRHRQTGQMGFFDLGGNPQDVFAGLSGVRVRSADGVDLRGRDRYSIAHLDQYSLSYSGRLLDDTVRVAAGIRAPYFRRDLNQYCYTSTSGSAYCTSQTPNAPGPTGLVTFTGSTTNYLVPFSGTKKYSKVLPNVGVSWHPGRSGHEIYVSYAEGFSAPRTDNLYNVQILNVLPETTRSVDLGYRYSGEQLVASAALWQSHFENRIVTSFDPDLGLSVDRNVGPVSLKGFDGSLGLKIGTDVSVYGTASYNNSKVENDIQYNSTVFVPTAGKELVETPKWTYGVRAEMTEGDTTIGLQGKYVSKRWSTDVNDQSAPAYAVWDLDARIRFSTTLYLQGNVINIFGRQYLGSIATSKFSADTTQAYGGAPLYAVGAPRTVQVSLRKSF